jgi:hypothetical protein
MEALKFTIIFMGLIAQIPNAKQDQSLAVLIKSPSPPHRARLIVQKDSVVPNPLFTKSLKQVKHDCPTDYRCYSLDGERVTVGGLKAKATTLDPSFTDHVPHLRKITAAHKNTDVAVNAKVLERQDHQDVTGDLSFTGGLLSVHRLWCSKVTWNDNGDTAYEPDGPPCPASEITFDGEPRENVGFIELTSQTGRVLRLKTSADVRVENVPYPELKGHVAHFHQHRLILDNARVIAEMLEGAKCDDTEGMEQCTPSIPVSAHAAMGQRGPRGTDYECTGSQWP